MKDRAKTFRNGWSVALTADDNGWMYTAVVRNARGDVHDKVRCDDYRNALTYYKAFSAIAQNT
jgi:hypothetical protein